MMGEEPGAIIPKTEVAWAMGGELTTDYSDYTDYLVWNFFTICNFGEVANGTYFNP
jgi:hypothetical protein